MIEDLIKEINLLRRELTETRQELKEIKKELSETRKRDQTEEVKSNSCINNQSVLGEVEEMMFTDIYTRRESSDYTPKNRNSHSYGK